jgi:ABC-type branched-subunit amino acid transport system substrate-binding protein
MTIGRPRLRALTVTAAALLMGMACGVSQGNTGGTTKTEVGVSADTITIGTTTPLSGPASFYAPVSKGANAYYQYVNAHGGINGRKINFIVLDDAYDAAKAVPLTHQLVEQDQVYAVIGQLGTPINTATRPYLNDQKVPDVFVATGATKWGAEYKTYPWTIGLQPDYQSEARVYAKDILAKHPSAKIGILYQNDDFGKDYVTGLTAGLGSHSSMIVSSQSYEAGSPDVSSQVAALKDNGVNLLLIAAIPTQGISAMKTLARLSWKPVVYITNVLTSTVNTRAVIAAGGGDNIDGMSSTFYGKDVNDPKWASDPVIAAYKSVLSQYCAQPCDPTDATYANGMGGAWVVVDVLKKLGRDGVTRDGLMKAVRSMNVKACADPNPASTDAVFSGNCDPWIFPGLTIHTGGDNQWPVTQLAPAAFSTAKGNWVIDYAHIINAR